MVNTSMLVLGPTANIFAGRVLSGEKSGVIGMAKIT